MRTLDVLNQLRARGARLDVAGGRLRCRAPRGVLTPELRLALERDGCALAALLADALAGWPDASREAVARFGVPHARLYPLLGCRVRTARGEGALVRVLSDGPRAGGVGVVLDASPGVLSELRLDEVTAPFLEGAS